MTKNQAELNQVYLIQQKQNRKILKATQAVAKGQGTYIQMPQNNFNST
jgi:hypothetical protein